MRATIGRPVGIRPYGARPSGPGAPRGIGEETVETHVSNILSRLHLADRTQAAIYGPQKLLVPLDEALE